MAQERPKSMECKQAHPTRRVDRILVRMVTLLGNLVGHIVDGDDPVKQRDDDENEKPQSEVVEEGVEIDALLVNGHAAGDDQGAEDRRREHPLREPEKGLTEPPKGISGHGE